jgi:DNA-directed RNA polymerase specialized sigma subunit
MAEFEKMAKDASAVGLVSLSRKWFETDSNKDVREIDVLEDKRGADPVREIQRKDLKELITKGLSRAERLIIILYYFEEMTMKEIGATLDLSEVARQPDAQQHPRPPQGPDGRPSQGIPAGGRGLITEGSAPLQ